MRDPFTDGFIGAPWEGRYGTQTESGGSVVIDGTSAYSALAFGADRLYDFLGSSITVEVVSSIHDGISKQNVFSLRLANGDNDKIDMLIENGNLIARITVAGAADYASDVAVAYANTTHRWWRIRHDATPNEIVWEYSADGITWTELRRSPRPAWTDAQMQSAGAQMLSGHYDVETGTTSVTIDNFNMSPDLKPTITERLWGGYKEDAFTDTAIDFQADLDQLEVDAGKYPPIINTFLAWSSATEFPAATMDTVRNHGTGHIPVLTWEPWNPANGVAQAEYALSTIIAGNHDAFITNFAQGAATWGHEVWLRFAHEMNGNWYPWCEGVNGNVAGEYVQAWNHVRNIFIAQGATNVKWAWSPNGLAAPGSALADLFPGDAAVDYIGFDKYNFGTATVEGWESPWSVIDHTVIEMAELSSKPMYIFEIASAEVGGSKGPWVQEAFERMMWLDALDGFLWFDVLKEADWRIASTVTARDAFRAGIADATWANSVPATSPSSTQTLYPVADMLVTGFANEAGGTVDIYTSIDEATASDTDYITTTPAGTGTFTYEAMLVTAGDPEVDTGHTVSYRIGSSNATPVTIRVSLRQGATEIAAWEHIVTALQTVEQTLSEAQASTITNYSDLRLRFEVTVA